MPIANTLAITLPNDFWNKSEADDGRLLGVLNINGVYFHVEAVEVERGENDHTQTAVGHFDDVLEGLAIAASPDGNWDAMQIDGKEYVVFMSPFC